MDFDVDRHERVASGFLCLIGPFDIAEEEKTASAAAQTDQNKYDDRDNI